MPFLCSHQSSMLVVFVRTRSWQSVHVCLMVCRWHSPACALCMYQQVSGCHNMACSISHEGVTWWAVGTCHVEYAAILVVGPTGVGQCEGWCRQCTTGQAVLPLCGSTTSRATECNTRSFKMLEAYRVSSAFAACPSVICMTMPVYLAALDMLHHQVAG